MRVIVVGAGIAGLTAARRLRQAGGADVTVLEASERIGGRLRRQRIADVDVDAGGAWVGPTQDRILALVTELGLETTPTYVDGKHLFRFDGRMRARGGAIPALGPGALVDLGLCQWRLDRLARRHPEDPAAPEARALDRLSVAEWVDRALRTRAARGVLEVAVGANFGCRLEDMSLLALVGHVRGAGGLAQLTGTRGAAQDARIVGGAVGVCERLAAGLARPVVCDAPVRAITQSEDVVRVVLDGRVLEADRVVLAVDPACAAAIDFGGALDPRRARLDEEFVMGSGIKFHIAYPSPFWRERGLSGQFLTDEGFVRLTFDATPPGSAIGILVGFLGEAVNGFDELLAPAGRDARAEAVARDVAAAFGRAPAPLDYVEQDWRAEPFLEGCVPALPPGVLSAAGAGVHAPVGRIHFAGAERSAIWEGHMDGAVRSAERAVAEVLAAATPRR
jgi:monoamine oxidase